MNMPTIVNMPAMDQSSTSSATDSVKQRVMAELQGAFQPTFLEVLNESHQHSVPAHSETHFKVTLVTADFEGVRPVKRHQLVYAQLQLLLDGPIHALALHTYTPDEWSQRVGVPDSPNCLGGSQHDRS